MSYGECEWHDRQVPVPAISASSSSSREAKPKVSYGVPDMVDRSVEGCLDDAIQAAKVGMETAQGTLTGQEPVVPGAEEVATPADPMADDPIDAVDAVDDVEVDVDIEEPASNSLGRARR